MNMRISNKVTAVLAMVLCGLLVAPAAAGTAYQWQTDGGRWDEPTNWSPTGIPVAGDTATIGDGTTSIVCIAQNGVATVLPDSVLVRNAATIQTLDNLGGQNIVVETGGAVNAYDYNTYGFNLDMADGTSAHVGKLTGRSPDIWTVSGTVGILSEAPYSDRGYVNAKLVGTGLVEVTATNVPGTMIMNSMEHTGGTHVLAGTLVKDRSGSVQFGAGDITLEPDTALRMEERYGVVLNPASNLYLLGTGANAAQLIFSSSKRGNTHTVNGAMFGGSVVPAGTYVGGTDYLDYLVNEHGYIGTLVVTTTLPEPEPTGFIPEPVSAVLVGLGGLGVLWRRRRGR